MSRRVLLINTNRCATPDPVFPLGLSHLNAALRRAGHITQWIDFATHAPPIAATVADFRPDLVGVSVRNIDDVLIRKREVYFNQLGDLTSAVRQTHPCPVVLGGSGYSIFPKRLLELTGADFGIQGEGEVSLLQLIASLSRGESPADIPGLVYRKDGRMVANPPVPSAMDTVLQMADRPTPLVQHYLARAGMLNVQTQRGCAHHCCYCTYPVIEGRTHRQRSPEAVAEEMAQMEAQGARYAFIVDSVFNSSLRHVTQVCEAIIRRGVKMRWGCFARPQGLEAELMGLMVRAGLTHLEFGSDSFCDSVLQAYDKHFTFADILHASELARAHKVDYCHFLICGGPGETEATLRTTLAHSQQLKDAVIMAMVGMRIYPGTALHQRALREGRMSAETDLLTPVYYLADGLEESRIFEMLQGFAKHSPNWVVGDPTPAYTRLVERLRSRGVTGPLWSYFSMVQRLWAPTTLASPA